MWLRATDKRRVAIFDATNTTRKRRLDLCHKARQQNVELLFVESICDDKEVLKSNYELKLQNDDYRGMDPDQAREDFRQRVLAYEKVYETIEDDEDNSQICYLKLVNVGQKTITRGCSGYLPSQVAFFLQNVHIQPRRIYFALAAENMDSVQNKVVFGSDNDRMTENGRQFALDLANYFESRKVPDAKKPGEEFMILTGPDSVSAATIGHLRRVFPRYTTALLSELSGGDMNQLSKDEMKTNFPVEYEKRRADRLRYRFPGVGGESYLDVIERTRPIVIELERQRKNVIVVCGKSVLRCLFAYFNGTEQSQIPLLKFNMHRIYELTPGPFGCAVREINPCVEF